MLNTQKYNLGKYNIAGGAESASGTVVAHSEMYGEPYVIYHASGSRHTIGKMEAAMPTRIVPITGNTIEATSDMEAQYYKRVEAIGTSADAVSGMTVQTAAVFGVDVLSLPELVLEALCHNGDVELAVGGGLVVVFLGRFVRRRAGGESEYHDQREKQCDQFFHFVLSSS